MMHVIMPYAKMSRTPSLICRNAKVIANKSLAKRSTQSGGTYQSKPSEAKYTMSVSQTMRSDEQAIFVSPQKADKLQASMASKAWVNTQYSVKIRRLRSERGGDT